MSADGQERLGQGGGAGGAGRPARRVPKFRRRAEARPDEVLDAALDLFIEKGFAATRVEDIAKRAGLSKGAIYLYFKSKIDIYMECIADGMLDGVSVDVARHVLRGPREPQP